MINAMQTTSKPPAWKVMVAFAIIYLVWGSTFLAIRIGVREVPPLLLAAMRFVCAGTILLVWTRARGTSLPTVREWRGAAMTGALIIALDYGLLFWAETRVPSGIAAVILATIPAFMTISEIVLLRTRRLTTRLGLALLVGVGGVAVLAGPSTLFNRAGFNQTAVDVAGTSALLLAGASWSIGSALTRKVSLPPSKIMSSGSQMFCGGILLLLAAGAVGEFHGFRFAHVSRGVWIALAYLIVAGSIVGFTAYIWLIHHESPTKVGTYAYVNPVVAVALGYFFGGESIGARTVAGTVLILVSVVAITTASAGKQKVVSRVSDRQVAEASPE
jgi:drug/metabolite transporter (DMT)-like permease